MSIQPPTTQPTTSGRVGAPPSYAGSAIADRYELGRAGEGAVVRWYESEGYTHLASRVRCRAGELDAIVRSPEGAVVFVEVKTRRGTRFGAAEAVNARKFATMRRCAGEWLQREHIPVSTPVRFDVCEVRFDGAAFHARRFKGVEDGAC